MHIVFAIVMRPFMKGQRTSRHVTATTHTHTHALNKNFGIHHVLPSNPMFSDLSLYITTHFPIRTDHLREYLNNNNFNEIVSPKQKISFISNGHVLSCARQTKIPCIMLESNEQNPTENLYLHSRMSFKILFQSYDHNAARMTEDGNKTHITRPFYYVSCVRVVFGRLKIDSRIVQTMDRMCQATLSNSLIHRTICVAFSMQSTNCFEFEHFRCVLRTTQILTFVFNLATTNWFSRTNNCEFRSMNILILELNWFAGRQIPLNKMRISLAYFESKHRICIRWDDGLAADDRKPTQKKNVYLSA